MKLPWQVLAFGVVMIGSAFGAGNKNGSELTRQLDNRSRPPVGRSSIVHTSGRRAPIVSTQTVNLHARRPTAQRQDARRACEPRRCDEGNQTTVIVNDYSDDAALAEYVNEQIQGFYQPGYDWGALLKSYQIDWAEFVPYLRKYIVDASELGRDAFRRGFIAGFGASAEATYNNALRQASQRS